MDDGGSSARLALPVQVYNHTLLSGNSLLEQAELAEYPKRDELNKRQADHILAAFRYQLLHSLDAWVNLRQGEVLWLEIEEDYSVIRPGGTTDVQVKRSAAAAGPTPRSLNSADVRDVLDRFWSRSGGGIDDRSRLVFIANSGAAQERDLAFPGNEPGLVYWARAAQASDTSSIRAALSTVFAGHPIGDWINTHPSDGELRTRLLRRVEWALNSNDVAPLTDLIRDEIAAIYLTKGLLATLADEAVRNLLDRVFETACQRNPQDRCLTAVDLHRSLEQVAKPTAMLQATARALIGASSDLTTSEVFVTHLATASPNIIDRAATVDEILQRLNTEPVIWLHGTHGTGKSTLARLLARRTSPAWLILDLRAVQDDARAALGAWRELLRTFVQAPHIDGIIIDDLAGLAFETLRSRVAALVTLNATRGLRLIVTSSHVPSAARFSEFNATPNAAVQAPYFSEADVLAFLHQQGGPSEELVEGWAHVVFMTTNSGHPLLVAAKIAGLRTRAWPHSALIEDTGLLASEAVQTTREEARRRLLVEIPSEGARQLLRRVGCVFDRADEALVLRLAQGDPSIANPGDLLAILRGSWIEVVPRNDLRLSPLIADIGRDVAEGEALRWRQIAAEHWLSTRVLNERTLPLCFWNAFWGKHTSVLAVVCQTIETLPAERLQGAAAMLSPMLALVSDRSIYPDVPPIGVMLRLLQFEVANAMEDIDAARQIAARLIVEIEEEQHEELRLLHFSLAIPKILMAANAEILPADQLDFALRLRTVQHRVQELDFPETRQVIESMNRQLEPGLDMAAFLIAVALNRIQDSVRMLATIEALDELGENDRNSFIDGAAIALGMSPGYFIHGAWAQDQLNGRDLRPTLIRLERMTDIVKTWGRSDIQIELVCARSVVLDEVINDRPEAIAIVDAGIMEFGSTPTLIRQKAKVLGHAGDDRAATDLIIGVEDTVGAGQPFDRYLALRDGGVSAARAERFDDAVRLFRMAHTAISPEADSSARAVGLLVEIALTQWTAKRQAEAIAALADAFDAVEAIDATESRQSERAHQIARAMVGLFWHDLDPYPASPRPKIAIGQASALAGQEPLLHIDLKPLVDNWRILALCEVELGLDVGIERRSRAKQSESGMAAVEMLIIMARYARAVTQEDLVLAFKLGIAAASAKSIVMGLRAVDSSERRASFDELTSKSAKTLAAEGAREILETIPLDLLIWHRLCRTWDNAMVAQLRTACAAAWGDISSVESILRAASEESTDDQSALAPALAEFLRPEFNPAGTPVERLRRDLLLVYYTSVSSARRILEPLVISELADGWSAVVENESFALRAPLQHTPPIQEAIAEMRTSGLKGAARLLLTAAPAVRFPLGSRWQEFLRALAG
jgi:hypothetical protein